ncbi:MAG: SDR family NAD(P)-dependent oxidoreductase, partial [Alphaproteobacteria bacterium]
MKDVSGKVVAITGGALGMGRLTADKFAGGGAKLALLDVEEEALRQAVEEIKAGGGEARGYVCDVSDRAQVYEVFKQIEQDLGPVSVLFNNAGVVFGGPLLEVADEQLEKTIQVNLIAHMWTMKAVLPGMIARGQGHIINFASMAGRIGVPLIVAYCASKTGVVGMTESL